ncbi:hypothetical protein ACH5RR_029783 [Cinchona calisaya]|uniref:NB-ARC domain-containing protein n=1 Tax=Cinchona calisaya TaxID=153742 RepID=A0ABD2YVZ4_9GENT
MEIASPNVKGENYREKDVMKKRNLIKTDVLKNFHLKISSEEIAIIKEKLRLCYEEINVANEITWINPEVTNVFMHENDDYVMNFDDSLAYIISQLTSNYASSLETVSIVGDAKVHNNSSLARRIYDDPWVVHFFHIRAWVTVSQEFNGRDIIIGLLQSIEGDSFSDEIYKELEEIALCFRLYKALKSKRYLVVIDDMWDTKPRDLFKCLPHDKNGSKILLTCSKWFTDLGFRPGTYDLPLLSFDESWECLCELVFGDQNCPPELVDIGKMIAKNCRGLMPIIDKIARFLQKRKT